MIWGKAGSLVSPSDPAMANSTVRDLQLARSVKFYAYNIIIIIFYVRPPLSLSQQTMFNSILQQLAFSSFWKLVFISLISYIVCSLQTFLIAPIRSVAVRLKISCSDDNTMTTWSQHDHYQHTSQHVRNTISLPAHTLQTKLFINPPRFTCLSRKLNSFELKNFGAEAICWLHLLKQEIKK